jgi:hypothetical protein
VIQLGEHANQLIQRNERGFSEVFSARAGTGQVLDGVIAALDMARPPCPLRPPMPVRFADQAPANAEKVVTA